MGPAHGIGWRGVLRFRHREQRRPTEDDEKRLEKEVQVSTDKAIKDIDTHLAGKEKELLTV